MNNSQEREGEDDDFYDNDQMDKGDSRDAARNTDEIKTKKKAPANKKPKAPKAEQNIPEDATPESMIEINDKLTTELEQLINAVDSQIKRVRKEKEEDLKQLKIREDPDEDVRRKENELKRAQVKIQTIKKEINQMKKQLDNAYDVEKTLELENELKDQETIYEKLVSETNSLKKVEKEQNKAFSILNEDEDADRRLQNIKEEVTKTKQEIREKNERLRAMEEEMKNQHTQMIEMEQKCRKIAFALKKKNIKQTTEEDQSTEQLTDEQVQEKIKDVEELEMLKKQEEKKFEKLIRQVEMKLTQVEHDKNIWSIKLKEKEQELKLNELRIKELKRQVPHKALKPLPNKENSKQQKKRSDQRGDQNDRLKKNAAETNPRKPKNVRNTSIDNKKDEDDKIKSMKVDRANDEEKEHHDKKDVSLHAQNDDVSPNGDGPSRLSDNNSKKDGFYDNSFLDEKSDHGHKDESPEAKPTQSNLKAKPFGFGSKKTDENKKNDKQDDGDEKEGNTFITGGQKAK